MGVSADIDRPDGTFLGSVDDVQHKLSEAFPGIRFVTEHGRGAAKLKGPLGLLFRILSPQYPYCEGYFEGQDFIATFNLGNDQMIRTIRMTLYGRGVPAAVPPLNSLSKRTGWRVRY